MGIFKRICMLVFSVAGLVSLVCLSLPWVGPWTLTMTRMLREYWYYATLEILVVITGCGLLVCLLVALFTRNRKVVVVGRAGADEIAITRDAIASQATHVIEEDGTLRARRVVVRAQRYGHVRVSCRVQPLHTIDTVTEGVALHDRIVEGLRTVCGDNVDKVEIEFVNASEYAALDSLNEQAPHAEAEEAAAPTATPAEAPAAPTSAASVAGDQAPAQPDTSEITLHLSQGSDGGYGVDTHARGGE